MPGGNGDRPFISDKEAAAYLHRGERVLRRVAVRQTTLVEAADGGEDWELRAHQPVDVLDTDEEGNSSVIRHRGREGFITISDVHEIWDAGRSQPSRDGWRLSRIPYQVLGLVVLALSAGAWACHRLDALSIP